jgi:hypothetical protein
MINTALRSSAILVALVALSGCGSYKPPTAPSNTTVSLFGTVTAEGGVKLTGATVRIGDGVNAGQSTTTNESGEYRFDGLVASNGNVSAIADGYDAVITGIYIDGRQPLDFTLRTSVPWSTAGIGSATFDMPTYVKRVQIMGIYTGVRSDFRVSAGGCSILDEALGTGVLTDINGVTYPLSTRHEAIYAVPASTSVLPVRSSVTVEIMDSAGGASWSMTEVRDATAVNAPCYIFY